MQGEVNIETLVVKIRKLYLRINNDYRSIFILASTLMNVNNKIKYTGWMTKLWPSGTMKHSYAQLVIVLNRLHRKVSANVVAFINF